MRLDRIEIVVSDPAWAVSSQDQVGRLTPVLDPHLAYPIEHIGSTAVPGLVAKPIIDMLAVVTDVDAAEAIQNDLASMSWVRDPEPRDETENRLSFCFPSRQRRSHHLHVVQEDHPDWRGWVAFRDRLRRDPDARAEYGALKQELAARFGEDPNDRNGYRAGKAEFVGRITFEELTRRR